MKYFPSVFVAIALLSACKNQPQTGMKPDEVKTTVQLPQDFLAFYDKFHHDSLYQLEHVVWPLQGDTSEQVDSTHYKKVPVRWQPGSWHMQRLDYNPNDYLREVQMLGDVLIIEHIRAKSANYGIERRFAKQPDDEWALIYYSDMQEISK